MHLTLAILTVLITALASAAGVLLTSTANGSIAFTEDPRTWSGRAVHEGLRWIAPFNMTEKRTTEDVLLGDLLIPAGTEIALVIGSANRDERSPSSSIASSSPGSTSRT